MAVLVWAVILVSGILGSQGEAIKKQAPLVCYRCDKVADAVDCTVTEACNSDEQCFTDKYISEEGNVYFTLGCKAKRICDILASFGKREVVEDMTDREKRNIIHLCTQCCASGYCNNKLCTVECYADVVMDQNHQVRHRMGCRSKVMCEAFLHHGHGLSHGRRAVGIGNDAHVAQLCGGCCNSDACNRGGCYTILGYNDCSKEFQYTGRDQRCQSHV
uniref:Uncharacterized protein n=1 Tax=Magallana gigas TaxID=29159 RepID=K1QBY2_MAGGI